MFSKLFNRQSPSGLDYFQDPKTSCYKQWFNLHHCISREETRETYYKAVFDLSIYWIAKFEVNLQNPYESKLSKEQIKTRNEIAAFELGCWYLSHLRGWLILKNHRSRNDILATFVHNFATIPLASFQINVGDIKTLIVGRMAYYESIKDINDIIATVSAQICSGFAIEAPVKEIPPANCNMLDLNQALVSPLLMVWMNRLNTIQDTWEKMFLSPVCLA